MSKIGKSARTRAEILDAAWDLIVERGAGISLAEIASAVGMTRQSIHVHFGSRGGLLLVLVRRADERADIHREFEAALAIPNARERFRSCLAVWFSFVPKIHPVAQDIIRLRATDEDAAHAWDDRMNELRKAFRQLVRSLDKEGLLTEGWNVARAADYLWAGCSLENWGLLVHDCGWPPGTAEKTISRALERALME